MYQQIFKAAPVGMFVIDANYKIRAWNNWMEKHTSISVERAIGSALNTLYPGFQNPRFDVALNKVFEHKKNKVLSYAVSQYLIPIPLTASPSSEVQFMPQQVYLSPLEWEGKQDAVLITVLDMTEHVFRSNTLLQMAFKLEEDSHRDALTGAYNRRFLKEWFMHQSKLISRYRYSIACLLIDIDHFKPINDEHGHDKGDQVLREFAAYVKIALRDSDILVRYGGEEFLVLLTHADMEMAHQVAERIRSGVEDAELAGLSKGGLTVSVGVACWQQNAEENYNKLLKRADDALYKAKRLGRNQVCE